jgi:hypothetical protein
MRVPKDVWQVAVIALLFASVYSLAEPGVRFVDALLVGGVGAAVGAIGGLVLRSVLKSLDEKQA